MNFIITPYVIICTAASVFAFMVMIMTLQRITMPGGTTLFFLMVGVVFWTGGYAMEYGTVGIAGKLVWAKVEYIGVVSSPLFFFLLALEYSPYRRFLTRRNVALLFIVPLFMFFLTSTNEWHGLIWSGFSDSALGNNLIVYHHGIAFWIGVVGYSYLLMLLGSILLIWTVVRSPSDYRYQPLILIISAAVPWIGNIVYVAGLSPLAGLELTPLLLVFSGALLTWNLFRMHLLDLVPVARFTLIETMTDGVLVLDENNAILDINPSAKSMIGEKSKNAIGKSAREIFAGWDEIVSTLYQEESLKDRYEITVEGRENNFLEWNIASIQVPHRNFNGRLVVIRDITRRKLIEDEISHANQRLRDQLNEIEILQESLREQAVRDSLTGLFNRRYLDETLVREFARALRNSTPVSICILDIDYFKEFNDTYGHIVGDVMLQNLAHLLKSNTRLVDIVCRYGGEEFVIVLPGMHYETAHKRIERLRIKFQKTPALYNDQPYFATFSGGVASLPLHGKTPHDVLLAADQALYAAKSGGRNCIKAASFNGIHI